MTFRITTESALLEGANKNSSIMLTGDLNLPKINWESGVVHGGTRALQYYAEALLEFCNQC